MCALVCSSLSARTTVEADLAPGSCEPTLLGRVREILTDRA